MPSDIESVWRIVKAAGWRRIGIDGVEGAGKSDLAVFLSGELGHPVLNLDDYLFQNQGGFVDFIDYPALSAAISSMPSLILSGVCLREVLERMQIDVDGHIYVKRMRNGLWADEDACVFPDGIDAAIETMANNISMYSQSLDEPGTSANDGEGESSPYLATEVMKYHDSYSPQEIADLVFERDV